jgi:hypothetical protein
MDGAAALDAPALSCGKWPDSGTASLRFRQGTWAALVTFAFWGAACALGNATAQEVAQSFRGKQIRLVIGSAPGGGYDLFARTIAAY